MSLSFLVFADIPFRIMKEVMLMLGILTILGFVFEIIGIWSRVSLIIGIVFWVLAFVDAIAITISEHRAGR